jgi:hypothetical protein
LLIVSCVIQLPSPIHKIMYPCDPALNFMRFTEYNRFAQAAQL